MAAIPVMRITATLTTATTAGDRRELLPSDARAGGGDSRPARPQS